MCCLASVIRSPMTRIMRVGSTSRVPGSSVGLGRLRRLDACLPVSRLLGCAALHRRPHVALDDAARRPRTFYLGEVEVVLLGQAPHYRRGAEVAVRPSVSLRLGLLPLLSFGLRGGLSLGTALIAAVFFLGFLGATASGPLGHLLAFALDKGYGLAYGDVLALVSDKLGELAGVLGFELQRNLVGLDLGYGVTLGNLVTLAFEPLDEGALLHRVAHLGHNHFRQLTSPPCRAPCVPRLPPASRSGRPRAPGSARMAPEPPPR